MRNILSLNLKKALFFLFFIIFFSATHTFSQPSYPTNYFRSPLDIPLNLAGNFAEMRPNHFHGGLDFKTLSVEGLNIYACAEGYVSRIKVSPYGYGKALYITHPNGLVTLYAHLQKYSPRIEEYIRQQQQLFQQYAIDVYLSPYDLPVEKSEVVAFSGNTGGSTGPHLHFEIRDEKTEYPLNPMLFGFDIKDETPPSVYQLYVYPLDDQSEVNGSHDKVMFSLSKNSQGNYTVPASISAHGNIGFGITANDFIDDTYNRCGIYSSELIADNQTVFKHELYEFSFYQTRYINSLIDYAHFRQRSVYIQKLFAEPNNPLSTYKIMKNRGVVQLKDDKTHSFSIVVKDAYQNSISIDFEVKSKIAPASVARPQTGYDTILYYGRTNFVVKPDFRMIVSENSIYDNVLFRYSAYSSGTAPYSKIHNVHDGFTGIQDPIVISIRADNLPENLQDKALIAQLTGGSSYKSVGGDWINGFVTTKIKYFGSFFVMTDVTPPVVQPVNIFPNANLSGQTRIRFNIGDNLSGIDSYTAFIDDQWIPFEYDAKYPSIVYYIDSRDMQRGKTHTLRLEVTDGKKNKTVYEAPFFW